MNSFELVLGDWPLPAQKKRDWIVIVRVLSTVLISLIVVPAGANDDELPIVPEGFVVDVVAREPMVSNPCVMTFDRKGRVFIGQGPQWRAPTPETPGDRVDILMDHDGDGVADERKTFAEGFNSIQGLAWIGGDLWIANAPDLTVVRDLNGDDEADVYIRVYTGLGNLEHSLHGLNFAPDGKLYMSKGNSRGYNRLDQLAPLAFRELWGVPSPDGAPDYPPVEVTNKAGYQRRYHTPSDDWGQSGGILRCDPYGETFIADSIGNATQSSVQADQMGRNLEIVSRGFRNPWDIAFDDGFNWLGTDNDQTQGDKIFSPFFGAHFGWGHSWSYHWTGEGHLPTVPASAPLFEGSGAGVVYYHAEQFPEEYRNLFFVNDWMRREVYAFRPEWNGALLECEDEFPSLFAHAGGGRTLPGSSGRVFEPTDIEVGPDGALYILSWGHGYGGTIENGEQIDAGRVYRVRHASRPLVEWKGDHRAKPLIEWTLDQLFEDLGSNVPSWRVDAQQELVRRAQLHSETSRVHSSASSLSALKECECVEFLFARLERDEISKAEQTWSLWTIGRLARDNLAIDDYLIDLALKESSDENARVQALRILANRHRFRMANHGSGQTQGSSRLPELIRQLLHLPDPRLRHETVQLVGQIGRDDFAEELIELAATELDRVTYYSTWNVLAEISTSEQRRGWLSDERGGVRLAVLLGLFRDEAIDVNTVLSMRTDSDPRVASLVELWLQKTGGAEPLIAFDPPAGDYRGPVSVTLSSSIPGATLNYTTDGSVPVNTSIRYSGPIIVDRNTTLKVVVTQDNSQSGPVATAQYKIRHVEPFRHRAFISELEAKAPGEYRLDWTGLAFGKRHYTDREYYITNIPKQLQGLPFLQMCNQHDRSSGAEWLSMTSDSDVSVLVGVDVRNNAPLEWMNIGQQDGFEDTGLELITTDPTFRIYRKRFPAGRIVLGGSTNHPRTDSGRGMYVVIFERSLVQETPSGTPVESEAVLAALETADRERGRELFLHPRGAGCANCHQMEGQGRAYAPDLSNIGSQAQNAEVLIQSILDPSAVITEGFAQHQILTTEGTIFRGAVIEESGLSLTLVDSEGVPTTIQKSEIEERIGTEDSPMPNGFGEMMTAQQVADIVAWLLSQTTIGDRSGFNFRERSDHIDIFLGEQRIATYLKDHPQLTRRALVNMVTLNGTPITRNFPPRRPEDIDPGYSGEDGIIHPIMHPGIWVGFGDVDGNDYWRLQADVVFDGFVEPLEGNRESGSFAVRNLFMSEDNTRVVCTEISRYRFEQTDEGLLLRIDVEYKSDDHDFYFGDQEESGLAVRVASPIRVQGGNGSILNNHGDRNGSNVWGKEANWFDYFGTIDDRQVGIMVASDPNNVRPSWLHARDYGVIVTNPFPKQPMERREPYIKTWVRQGESLKLSYAILIHDSPSAEPIDRESAAESLLNSFN